MASRITVGTATPNPLKNTVTVGSFAGIEEELMLILFELNGTPNDAGVVVGSAVDGVSVVGFDVFGLDVVGIVVGRWVGMEVTGHDVGLALGLNVGDTLGEKVGFAGVSVGLVIGSAVVADTVRVRVGIDVVGKVN